MTARRATRLASTSAKRAATPPSTPTVKAEPTSTPPRASKRRKVEAGSPLREIKPKPSRSPSLTPPPPDADADADDKANTSTPSKPSLASRKLKSHTASSTHPLGPFPSFPQPTPSAAALAHEILARQHGPRLRPASVVADPTRAGCGDSPSVLDALVRTILSQNTSDTNSTRAKLSMDRAYGSSDAWDQIAAGGQAKLEEAIRCGGLSQVKSKVILKILDQAMDKYGAYSLDHLHEASTEDAMAEMLSFDGVGPKTASCVLLFCLQRDDFAVDTHVHRITGLLGWRPKTANREQTYAHLNRRIPDEHKYGLHILLVTHGKKCAECKAGGRSAGKCELRRAFRDGAPQEEPVDGKDGVKDEVDGLQRMDDEDHVEEDGVKVESAEVTEDKVDPEELIKTEIEEEKKGGVEAAHGLAVGKGE